MALNRKLAMCKIQEAIVTKYQGASQIRTLPWIAALDRSHESRPWIMALNRDPELKVGHAQDPGDDRD